MRKHSYVSAEKFILSREFFGMKLGLENITEFLSYIDNPQNKYLTIHISGTNGKGSTASILAAIFQENGYKTGLFTSPHLVSLRERIRVNGNLIRKNSVTGFINRNRSELSRRKLSFFELISAMAFDYFSRQKVDVAIIETGLGGRLDATNVLSPILTITTGISKDHSEILGKSLPIIAKEKAGIIKPTVPHLVGLVPENTLKVFKEKCKKEKSKLYKLSQNHFKINPSKMTLDYNDDDIKLNNVSTSLNGIFQLHNTALSIKAVKILKQSGLKLSWNKVRKALNEVSWQGRFQIIENKSKPKIILDVSHNVEGIDAFVKSYQMIFGEKKAEIITGFVKRKEHQKMFDKLGGIAKKINIVPLSTRRSVDLDEMIENIHWRKSKIKKYATLKTAYKNCLKNSFSDDIIIIIGSHYLIGEFFEKYKNYGF